MHEVSVMCSIIDSVLAELERHEIAIVQEVVLRVGELTFLGSDQLIFAFEILSRGTSLEGAELVIEREDAEILCRACGYKGGIKRVEENHFSMPVLSCPSCGESTEILRGRNCFVDSIKVVES